MPAAMSTDRFEWIDDDAQKRVIFLSFLDWP
jgi:hypothetical protein